MRHHNFLAVLCTLLHETNARRASLTIKPVSPALVAPLACRLADKLTDAHAVAASHGAPREVHAVQTSCGRFLGYVWLYESADTLTRDMFATPV